jgi:hypothetical protein
MAEDTTPVVTTSAVAPATTSGTTTTFTIPTTTAATAEDTLGDAGKQALAEERKAKREAEKQLKELSTRLKEYEDRDKSELQKLQERAETAEREREALLVESLKARVALVKGLPAELADRLRGTTEDELSADADALLALVPTTTRPRGDVDQGARAAFTHLNDGDGLERAIRQKVFGS